ncbi:hypothetical protein T484DRAFT_1895620 [Baffinella frigidus]|nr:hypothetical protein T484DRAFT_1895620 [Cryptophyta sp. CCMP2293]
MAKLLSQQGWVQLQPQSPSTGWAQHAGTRATNGPDQRSTPRKSAISLGLQMDPVGEGLKVVQITPRGLAWRSGRVSEGDIILTINDADVVGRSAQQLAALVELNTGEDGNGACVLLLRRENGTKARVVLDTRAPLPAEHAPENDGITTDDHLSHHAHIASDTVGLGLTLGQAGNHAPAGLPIVALSPLGSARWSGMIEPGDLLTHVDGAPVAHLAPDGATALLAGARGAAPHCMLTLLRNPKASNAPKEPFEVELSRAPPGSASAGGSSAAARYLTSLAPDAPKETVSKADGRALLKALDQLRGALKNGASFAAPLPSLRDLPPDEALAFHRVCEQVQRVQAINPAAPLAPELPGERRVPAASGSASALSRAESIMLRRRLLLERQEEERVEEAAAGERAREVTAASDRQVEAATRQLSMQWEVTEAADRQVEAATRQLSMKMENAKQQEKSSMLSLQEALRQLENDPAEEAADRASSRRLALETMADSMHAAAKEGDLRLELETMAESMHAAAEEGDLELMALLKSLVRDMRKMNPEKGREADANLEKEWKRTVAIVTARIHEACVEYGRDIHEVGGGGSKRTEQQEWVAELNLKEWVADLNIKLAAAEADGKYFAQSLEDVRAEQAQVGERRGACRVASGARS